MLQRLMVAATLFVLLVACDKGPTPQNGEGGAGAETVESPSSGASVKQPAIDIEDPTSCKGCHGVIYREWTESMHSRAHHEEDPIYGAMRAFRMEKQGEHIASSCARCHNPRSPKAPDAAAGRAGVSCAACHNVAEVHVEEGKVGVETITWDGGGVMRSSRDLEPGASPVHGTGEALSAMQDGETLCLSCHNATKTPRGVAACTTGPEFREHGGEQTCVSCHMPEVEGAAGAVGRQERHASHQFLGPHRAWYQDDPSFLESGLDVSAAFVGDALEVTLVNQSAHGFPSGFPGRLVIVKVVGEDAKGGAVWKNVTDMPMAEHPDSMLNKVYHDAEGEPVPAAFSVKLARDNRLKPDETRTITYAIPANVRAVQVSVVYRLLPPKLAKVLGLAEREEATPRVIGTARARR